jgi:hypothetical protein
MFAKTWFAFLLLPATILLAATVQPLNVNTGLWQVTGTNNVAGSDHPINYKKCVSEKQLGEPWVNGPDEKCTWTVVNSTGTDMEVNGKSCEAGKQYGMETNIDLKLHVVDSENVNATMQGTMTGNGQTMNMNGKLKAKWLGAKCGSDD